MDKKKQSEWKRHRFQILWAFLTNSYLVGFAKGKIYDGKLKNLCVPGLNCYSCPGSLGSCPIGAMQAVIGSWNFRMAFYVAGFLVFVGSPYGTFCLRMALSFRPDPDLLHKIPFVKKISTFRGDRLLRKLKYVIFLVFVILLPMFVVDMLGQGAPYFCKLICPRGNAGGRIPLVLLNSAMRAAVGWLYAWKNVLLVVIVLLSVAIYRPFCKLYLSPGRGVFGVQSHCGFPLPGGQRGVCSLRRLCESLQNAGGSVGNAQSSGMYPLWLLQKSLSHGSDLFRNKLSERIGYGGFFHGKDSLNKIDGYSGQKL